MKPKHHHAMHIGQAAISRDASARGHTREKASGAEGFTGGSMRRCLGGSEADSTNVDPLRVVSLVFLVFGESKILLYFDLEKVPRVFRTIFRLHGENGILYLPQEVGSLSAENEIRLKILFRGFVSC